MLGFLLSQPNPPKKILSWGYPLSGLFIICGALYWLFIDNFLTSLNVSFHIHPIGFVIFSIGLEVLIVLIFLHLTEFNPNVKLDKRIKNTVWIRKWGVLSFTLYTFNILEIIPEAILNRLVVSVNFPLGWTIFMIAIVILMWNLIIQIFEVFKYKGTLEWIIWRIFKSNDPKISEGINPVYRAIFEVEPILFLSYKELES